MAFLEGPSLKQAEIIKQEIGEAPGDIERGVQDLRNMLAASPHLPQPEYIDERMLQCFVRGCRMDLNRARKKLEAYCLARVRCKDLFEHHSFNVPPFSDTCRFIDIIVLPKLTDEGYRVTIFRVKPDYPEDAADVGNSVRALLILSDVRMLDEHDIAGDVFVYEVAHMRGSVVTNMLAALNTVRRVIQTAQAAYPQRLKRFHIIGSPPFMASSLTIMLNFLSEKIRKRYYVHTKLDELLNHIPVRVLPREWGGEEESIEVLANKWRRRIDERNSYFQTLKEACNAVPVPFKNVEIYGTAGAFRQLAID